MHRSHFDWDKANKRHQSGTVENRIFSALKRLIALRKETLAFADFDNRQLLALDNPRLLAFYRTDPLNNRNRVLVLANFNVEAQTLPVSVLRDHGFFLQENMKNLCTGERIVVEDDAIALPQLSFYWLTD